MYKHVPLNSQNRIPLSLSSPPPKYTPPFSSLTSPLCFYLYSTHRQFYLLDSMKNRGRNRLLMCFRPVATVEGPTKFKTSDGSGDPVPTYMALGGGGKEMISEILTSLPDEENSDGDVAGVGIDRKEKSRRRFSRALKDVLFDILLAKKIGSKKYRINSFRSNSNLSTKSQKISKSTREKLLDAEDMLRTNSSRSSSIFSYTTNGSGSSCASSIASNPRSVSQRNGSFRTNSMELKQVPITPTKKVSRGVFSSNTGLSLLLLSLLVLIFWGKVCAIVCTSTWLFFVPGQSKGGDLAVNMVGMLDVDSHEYKKRIILEGLLERNRSRVDLTCTYGSTLFDIVCNPGNRTAG